MPDRIGPHLLGRVPHPGDPRDYRMLDALDKDFSSASSASDLLNMVQSWSDVLALWRWWKANRAPLQPRMWTPGATLDQGDTPHCVGFGSTDYLNAEPIESVYGDDYANAFYYRCKEIDGEPEAENGTTVHSAAKVLVERGFVKTYVWAKTVEEIRRWVQTKGPVVIGSSWYSRMYRPDGEGFVTAGGTYEGGHCYLLLRDDGNAVFLNSWGLTWGMNGLFKMRWDDFSTLWADEGNEAMSALQVKQ